jgi:hypothetical protein
LKKRFFADLIILFVRNNEYKKIKLDSILRTIIGFTLVIREYDSINLRLGGDLRSSLMQKVIWNNENLKKKKTKQNKTMFSYEYKECLNLLISKA